METRILRPSKTKWFGVMLVGLLLGAGGVIMIMDGKGPMGWFITLFFGLVGAVGLYNAVTPYNYLKLEENGLEQKMMGRTLRVEWTDIVEFGLARVSQNTFVTFTQASKLESKMGKVNKKLVNATSQLSDNFGMEPKALVDLMVVYWRAAMEKQNQD